MYYEKWHKKVTEKSFFGVALFFILAGVGIFTYGSIEWLINYLTIQANFYFPSFKIATGLVIMVLGYIQLELELLRKK